jgi:hypothetical protein
MNERRAYLHSQSAGGCGFTTVIPERHRARFAGEKLPELAHCAHCWRDVPVSELKWADGSRVGA